MRGSSDPAVSVVIPSYNRAHLLADAFESVRCQTYTDWELIVVDDGSVDDTRAVVTKLSAGTPQRVHYEYQQNQGPAAARNRGVACARGRYIAFLDSDDAWLPHHLQNCVAALEASPDVDWVYGACRLVALGSDTEIHASSFYPHGKARDFLKLGTETRGSLRVIRDPRATECMLTRGLMCGLQCSVIRRRLLEQTPLPAQQRCGEDQTFVVLALKAGNTFAYLDDVHVIYRVHDDSVSARNRNGNVESGVRYVRELAEACAALPEQVAFTDREIRALRRRLAHDYFWTIGYSFFWQNGYRADALAAYRTGLRWQPWNPRMWKTYGLALARNFGRRGRPARAMNF
jgi:glycosyltransferase involved in cell wall biosynthesis